MDIYNKKILVVGLGISGAAAAKFLCSRGASVTVTDMADEKRLEAVAAEMRSLGIRTELGGHRRETFENADMIVISPGVPHGIAPILCAQEKGVPVIGEIELAYRFIKAPIIAITGTNGKSTTTTLTGNMLKHSGIKVFVGGNIGTPLISYVDSGDNADAIVLEVSSFQLDTIDSFKPKIAVLLNITTNHLDRYPDFNGYAASKARIFKNQTQDDVAVINLADPIIQKNIRGIKSRILDAGAWTFDAGYLEIEAGRFFLNETWQARHNIENAVSACLAAAAAGATPEGIQTALDTFKGLPHRIEYVATIKGVRYYDDSKATSVDAVAKALASFSDPVILIMGGRGKGINPFASLAESVRQHVKTLIVMGETKDAIKSALGRLVYTESVSSMESAVLRAADSALEGDVVLLSPACASFDMYSSYAERGEDFCRIVSEFSEFENEQN